MTHFKLAFAAAMLCVATAAQAAEGTAQDALFGSPAISENQMSQLRGGAEVIQNASQGADCNSCSISAASSVSGNAFQNASGIITVIQNTGINAVLQNSTVVNINIH
ncbi:MAG TPA: hypothetical protein VGU20_21480 [Stellaceae bacterium]|nr:hypothetical protein [Stellaceae bacterium]